MNAKRAAAFEAASAAAARAAAPAAAASAAAASAQHSSGHWYQPRSDHASVGSSSSRSTVVGNGQLHYRRGENTFANRWLDDHTPGHSLRILVGALGELYDTLTS